MFGRLALLYLVAILFWLWGISIGFYEVFPYRYINSLLQDIEATLQGHEETGPELGKEIASVISSRPVFHLRKRVPELEALGENLRAFPSNRTGQVLGVVTSDAGRNAFFLYDSFNTVFHKWDFSYKRIFPKSKDGLRKNIHGAMMLGDGSVIANFDEGGIARLNWCGDIMWSFEDPITHHLFSKTNRNTIWVPSRNILESSLYGFPAGSWDDLLVELSIDTGEIVQSISSVEILKRNELHGNLEFVDSETDFTHINDIEELSSDLAAAFPDFEAGDLIVNAKRINMVFVVDPDTLEVKWHQQHPWNQPHDPDFLPNGKIRLFDNNQDRKGDRGWGQSRILLISPQTRKSQTIFEHPAFHSDTGSLVQGSLDDMLVVSSIQSTLLNVRNGEINFVFWRPFDEKSNYYIKYADWYEKPLLPEGLRCR